jgi:hypothetical protein
LIVIHSTPQVQTGIKQSIIEIPQAADDNLVNEDVQNFLKLLNNHKGSPLEKVSHICIASDNVVYLQESDYNINAENDPKTLSLRCENCIPKWKSRRRGLHETTLRIFF